jgi:hypothetical protein
MMVERTYRKCQRVSEGVVCKNVIRVSAWPSCSEMTPIGTPFMASAEPCVWRSTWNEISGLVFARRQASRIDLTRPRGSEGARRGDPMSRTVARARTGQDRPGLYQEITDKIIAELEACRVARRHPRDLRPRRFPRRCR